MSSSSQSESIDFLLAQICRLHHARAHTLLETLGLYHGQPPMLRALWKQEGLTHSELAASLHVQPATMTKMVQRMEKAGFVKAEVKQVWRTLESETFEGFTMEERVLLRRFFLQVRENLIRVTEDKPAC
jgi:hypothetical protein